MNTKTKLAVAMVAAVAFLGAAKSYESSQAKSAGDLVTASWMTSGVPFGLWRDLAPLVVHGSSSLTAAQYENRLSFGFIKDSETSSPASSLTIVEDGSEKWISTYKQQLSCKVTMQPSMKFFDGLFIDAKDLKAHGELIEALRKMNFLHELSHCEEKAIFASSDHPLFVSMNAGFRFSELARAVELSNSEKVEYSDARAVIERAKPGSVCLESPETPETAVRQLFGERFSDVRAALLMARVTGGSDVARNMTGTFVMLRTAMTSQISKGCVFDVHDSAGALASTFALIESAKLRGSLSDLVGTGHADDARVTKLAAEIAMKSMESDRVVNAKRIRFAFAATSKVAKAFAGDPSLTASWRAHRAVKAAWARVAGVFS